MPQTLEVPATYALESTSGLSLHPLESKGLIMTDGASRHGLMSQAPKVCLPGIAPSAYSDVVIHRGQVTSGTAPQRRSDSKS